MTFGLKLEEENQRKWKGDNPQPGEERSREQELEIAAREKCLREVERDQTLLEKEELIIALANAKTREDNAKDQNRQLRK
ncbi:hypothetical protein CR513_01513, partial [Mucuna pruriens]